MKHIFKNCILRALLAIAGAALLLASCSGIESEHDTDSVDCTVSISLSQTALRAASPMITDVGDYTSFELTGVKDGGSSQSLRIWQTNTSETAYEQLVADDILIAQEAGLSRSPARVVAACGRGRPARKLAPAPTRLPLPLSLLPFLAPQLQRLARFPLR